MRGGNKKHYLILAFNYSAQPYIVVHCSNVGKKNLPIPPLLQYFFFVYSGAKNSFLAPLLLVHSPSPINYDIFPVFLLK